MSILILLIIILTSSQLVLSTRNRYKNPDVTTCEEFEKGALFDPKKILDSTWKIFYFWANTTEMFPILFSLPDSKSLRRFRDIVEGVEPNLEIPWDKARLFMAPRPGVEIVMLFQDTPGAYRAIIKREYIKNARPLPQPLVRMADVRLKQVGRLIAMMSCEDFTGYAMIRSAEIPTTLEECEALATTIGYRHPQAHCYLDVHKRDDL